MDAGPDGGRGVPSQVINRKEAGGPTPAGRTPMLKVVADEAVREDLAAGLDEIAREGAVYEF